MTADDARRLALAFPDAVEADHHGRPSFRVGGRIFATLWSPAELNVMAGEDRIVAAVERWPATCSPVHWGRRLSAVRVALPDAGEQQVEELLHAAWSRIAER